MRVTFLGHQGWHFESGRGGFLLDPILEAIGNGATRLPVWPQRRLQLGRMGPIDAVIISHEHADHFSLETLLSLPTPCRVYVPDLASLAMCAAIREMGFSLTRFSPLEPFLINGIRITALPALYNRLEPDVYAMLMQDETGASFLTSIDTLTHPGVLNWLRQNCPIRTLDNLTNNFVESRQRLVDNPRAWIRSKETVAADMKSFVRDFAPLRAVVTGQGWCFEGDKTELNHSFFSVDNRWLTQAAREHAPHVHWIRGMPGMCFQLNGLEFNLRQSDAVSQLPDADRSFRPESLPREEPFGPWTGECQIGRIRLEQVQGFVREHYGPMLGLCAPKLMETLYYLKFRECGALVPTLAVTLRDGDTRWDYMLDYGQLSFTQLPQGARAAVGFEIWASDLELLIGAREESFLIYESAVRCYSEVADLIEGAALVECFMGFTPRFRPQETLAFYRSRIQALRPLVETRRSASV